MGLHNYSFCLHTVTSKTVLFRTIQFSISSLFSSIWPIDSTLSGGASPGQNEPGSDGNKGVPYVTQSSIIIGVLPSDCSVSYPGHSLGKGSYPSAEMQLMYYTAPADWAKKAKREINT